MELSQKLKELRKKQGLTQLELAERLFVSRQAISGWEAGTSRPSTENLQSLSRLFNIPLETLLDDYNLFLRKGQGEQIKTIRTKLGLTQKQYADKLGVSLGSLKQWEQNRKQIFKSTWEKYFKQSLESCK